MGDWGLYRAAYEKDSCGFGLIASLDDQASHWVLQTAISSFNRLTHRGAIAADGKTGDGCGLLIKQPTRFLARRGGGSGIHLGAAVRRRPRVSRIAIRPRRRSARRCSDRTTAAGESCRSPDFARLPMDPSGLRRRRRSRPCRIIEQVFVNAGARHRRGHLQSQVVSGAPALPKSGSRPTIRCSTSRRCRRAPSSTRAW